MPVLEVKLSQAQQGSQRSSQEAPRGRAPRKKSYGVRRKDLRKAPRKALGQALRNVLRNILKEFLSEYLSNALKQQHYPQSCEQLHKNICKYLRKVLRRSLKAFRTISANLFAKAFVPIAAQIRKITGSHAPQSSRRHGDAPSLFPLPRPSTLYRIDLSNQRGHVVPINQSIHQSITKQPNDRSINQSIHEMNQSSLVGLFPVEEPRYEVFLAALQALLALLQQLLQPRRVHLFHLSDHKKRGISPHYSRK